MATSSSSSSRPRKSSGGGSSSTGSSGSSSSGGSSTGTALRDLAASALTTDTILDLIDKLGVKDIVVSRIRTRLEEVNVDDIIDEAIDYVRRHPEVIVITLGTITIASALVVFLESRRDYEYVYEMEDEEFDDDHDETNVQPIKSSGSRSSSSKSSSSKSGSRSSR
ncbi:MAG TPA: hypothetical protein VFN10_12110 [Thermoanaerobaculia bacterium]|nr:hypothetical protein [Thermoanaerobaculia bacterium]